MAVDDDDFILFNKDKVGPMEIIKLRSNRIRDDMKKPVSSFYMSVDQFIQVNIHDNIAINKINKHHNFFCYFN